jgi:hypothetical protein
VTFSTGNYEGEISKHVVVKSNDPAHSDIELTVSGNIRIDFKLEPDGIIFRNLRRYMELTREIRIQGERCDQINIVKIESANDHITGTVHFLRENNKSVPIISVKIKPGLPLGRVNETLTVFTDSSKYHQVPLRIHGEIIGNISVTPERIDFGFFNKESPPVKTITLTMEKPDDRFEIQGIEDPSGMLGNHVVTVKEGTQYQVSVNILPKFNKRLISGSLFVRTNYSGEEKITVNVFGGIKSQMPSP